LNPGNEVPFQSRVVFAQGFVAGLKRALSAPAAANPLCQADAIVFPETLDNSAPSCGKKFRSKGPNITLSCRGFQAKRHDPGYLDSEWAKRDVVIVMAGFDTLVPGYMQYYEAPDSCLPIAYRGDAGENYHVCLSARFRPARDGLLSWNPVSAIRIVGELLWR